MKQRSTTPVSRPRLAVTAVVVAAFVLSVVAAPLSQRPEAAYADIYDQKIAEYEAQINQYQARGAELAEQANSLQNQIDILRSQQSTIQAQINATQARLNQLKEQIAVNEQKIVTNKSVLGDTLASLYVDGSVTPLEMLASSSNIGDYVDKQTNREAMRDGLVEKIGEIRTAQEELAKQKTEVEQNIADQESQKQLLASKQADIDSLLAETRGQEASYNQLAQATRTKQDQTRDAQQAAIAAAMRANSGGSSGNVVAGSADKGGYPAYLASSNYYNPLVDPWGMYSRQCVSYVAWKVYQKNGSMPYWGGRGNASQWPGNAARAGIATGSTPRVGSAGVIYGGPYGHIVWVNSVNSDGTINISQYNYDFGTGPGQYSEMYNVSPSAYDVYIYF